MSQQLPSIGILAGMGARSTAPFIDLVVSECQRQYGARDDIDFPRMMICSQPAPFYEDRPVDHAALEGAIRDGLQHLESTGVDAVSGSGDREAMAGTAHFLRATGHWTATGGDDVKSGSNGGGM